MRLVGEDGEGEFPGGEGREHLGDAGVEGGAFHPVPPVVVDEALVHQVRFGVGGSRWESASAEHPGAVPDEAAHCFPGVSGIAPVGEGVIEGQRDSREGIDQGAVEIENGGADHAGPLCPGRALGDANINKAS